MATTTKVVIGTVHDGDDGSSTGTLAKKINDIATAATTIHSIVITKWGRLGMAVIVYS